MVEGKRKIIHDFLISPISPSHTWGKPKHSFQKHTLSESCCLSVAVSRIRLCRTRSRGVSMATWACTSPGGAAYWRRGGIWWMWMGGSVEWRLMRVRRVLTDGVHLEMRLIRQLQRSGIRLKQRDSFYHFPPSTDRIKLKHSLLVKCTQDTRSFKWLNLFWCLALNKLNCAREPLKHWQQNERRAVLRRLQEGEEESSGKKNKNKRLSLRDVACHHVFLWLSDLLMPQTKESLFFSGFFRLSYSGARSREAI